MKSFVENKCTYRENNNNIIQNYIPQAENEK